MRTQELFLKNFCSMRWTEIPCVLLHPVHELVFDCTGVDAGRRGTPLTATALISLTCLCAKSALMRPVYWLCLPVSSAISSLESSQSLPQFSTRTSAASNTSFLPVGFGLRAQTGETISASITASTNVCLVASW